MMGGGPASSSGWATIGANTRALTVTAAARAARATPTEFRSMEMASKLECVERTTLRPWGVAGERKHARGARRKRERQGARAALARRRTGTSHVVALGRAAPAASRRAAPPPAQDPRVVLAVLRDVLPVLDQRVPDRLLRVRGAGA